MKIYHNPRCRKSRETLTIIQEHGIEPEIIEYLKDAPTVDELKDIVAKLKVSPLDIIRTKEEEFKSYKGMDLSDDEWLLVMAENPKLIERPIVIEGSKAVLGRPPENVNELLK